MKRKSLIADDVRASRMLVSRFLYDLGYETIEVTNGKDAWHLMGAQPFDLIVTDIEMPEQSGLELLLQIRQHSNETIKCIPVIVVTSIQDATLETTAIDFGATAVCYKPIDKHVFQDQVRYLVSKISSQRTDDASARKAGPISPTLRRLVEQARCSVSDNAGSE